MTITLQQSKTGQNMFFKIKNRFYIEIYEVILLLKVFIVAENPRSPFEWEKIRHSPRQSKLLTREQTQLSDSATKDHSNINNNKQKHVKVFQMK